MRLRRDGGEANETNLSLLGIVEFWVNRSPLLWLAAASVGYVAKSGASAMVMGIAGGIFGLSLCMSAVSAIRLYRLVGNEELRTYLVTPRPVAEQVDASLL
ncbi:hypothetical protein [Hydrogenophaga taeniospiralis]|uniref:hypothetical protein n=1 Tax=Hydrogenophaga taeniospiralis TaxID=65656 RepID=UPI001CFA8453|nr:hypothetical protein [Hydrogenophaga taeniospiralis]UCU92160.1 hypothetical protein KI616_14930 [Hydrogenophaga taeniospiralis]